VTIALRGQPGPAQAAFWKAFLRADDALELPLDGRLAVLEVLEAVFEYTHDERYRDLIVDLAQRQERIGLRSYAFAFEAKYTRSQEDRIRALAFALYLDRRSLRIQQFTPTLKREALAWWTEAHPFTASE
jgi:hypothetical protein